MLSTGKNGSSTILPLSPCNNSDTLAALRTRAASFGESCKRLSCALARPTLTGVGTGEASSLIVTLPFGRPNSRARSLTSWTRKGSPLICSFGTRTNSSPTLTSTTGFFVSTTLVTSGKPLVPCCAPNVLTVIFPSVVGMLASSIVTLGIWFLIVCGVRSETPLKKSPVPTASPVNPIGSSLIPFATPPIVSSG